VLAEPRAQLVAEGDVGGREVEVHGRSVLCDGGVRSTCWDVD
jgi:hypothetical protein